MDKLNRKASEPTKGSTNNPANTAEAVQKDFADLVEMFERQLASLAASNHQAQWHLAKAKVAAERGLHLSRQLIEDLGS